MSIFVLRERERDMSTVLYLERERYEDRIIFRERAMRTVVYLKTEW